MQYHRRNRPPPPPPPSPFGRGGGAVYPRGRNQLYTSPPQPLPSMPPAPQRKYEVLMQAGRLAAEHLVSQGVLPPAALHRGNGVWAVPPLPPPSQPLAPPPSLQESPVFYGRRRHEDEYNNNPSARHRRTNGTTNSTSSRDDYSSGSYNGGWKRKYGEYRRYSDSGRDREKERGRAFSNSQRYEEDEDEDGAPGFRREWQGSLGGDEVRSSFTEAAREETPLMAKVVEEFDKEDTKSKVVSSIEDVQKDADAVAEVQDGNEEGEVDDDSKVLNSESEVVEQATDTDTNTDVMELGSNQLPDGIVPDKNAEDSDKISDEAAFDDSTSYVEVTNVEPPNLLAYCDFAKGTTRPRSVRAHRNAASASRGISVAATVDIVSSEQAYQMVIDESAKPSSLSITKLENEEDQIYRENTSSGVFSDEPMLLQENGTSVVIENIREEKGDEQLHLVQEYKEETNLSPFTASHMDSVPQQDSLMRENLAPLTACHKDSLPQEDNLMLETDLPPVTASHKNNSIKETKLSSLPVSHKDNLMHGNDLSQTMSSLENNLKLQFNDGAQVCDFDTLQQDVDLIELPDKREIIGADLCPNVGADTAIKMEEDQSDSLKISDLDRVGGTEVAALHDKTTLAQSSAAGSFTEPHEKQLEDLGTTAGANPSATDDLCQLPLENKDVQLNNIECDGPIEVGGIGSPKSKNEMICSSMDNIMHPGLHTDVLPGIQDSYNLDDFLGPDIPCYPPMQSDLNAGIGANDSEGITIIDDPIYGSLTDIDFDVWGQPTQDYDKFF